jgi:hypothetical protein
MVVKRMHPKAVEVERTSGESKGRRTTSLRILCNSKPQDFGFVLTRRHSLCSYASPFPSTSLKANLYQR